MAFTSNLKNAGSDHSPFLTLILKNGETKRVLLYDLPGGNDMFPSKGDLWTFKIDSFKFKQLCIRKKNIAKVTISQGGKDGWNIESVTTVLRSAQDDFTVVTADMGVKRWIDGDDKPEHRSFDLTIV